MASGRTPLLRVAPDAVLLADEPLFRGTCATSSTRSTGGGVPVERS